MAPFRTTKNIRKRDSVFFQKLNVIVVPKNKHLHLCENFTIISLFQDYQTYKKRENVLFLCNLICKLPSNNYFCQQSSINFAFMCIHWSNNMTASSHTASLHPLLVNKMLPIS